MWPILRLLAVLQREFTRSVKTNQHVGIKPFAAYMNSEVGQKGSAQGHMKFME